MLNGLDRVQTHILKLQSDSDQIWSAFTGNAEIERVEINTISLSILYVVKQPAYTKRCLLH